MFLNNKLDELLIDFGERKCKSADMILKGDTGMPMEPDPRKTRTWPISSPTVEQEYQKKNPKFTEADKYNIPYEESFELISNCYYEGVDPPERIPTPEPEIIIKKLEVDQDDKEI